MRIDETTNETSPKGELKAGHVFMMYHPATDWHSVFHELNKKAPLQGLIGWSNSMEALLLYARRLRSVVPSNTVIHILLPSAHTYLFKDLFEVSEELFPLAFEGQIHHSGDPYVFVNVTDESLNRVYFNDVGLVPRPAPRSWGKTLATKGAAAGAGVAGGIGALFAGGGVLVGLEVACLVVAGPVALTGVALGAAAVGTTTALLAGNKVDDNFNKDAQARRKELVQAGLVRTAEMSRCTTNRKAIVESVNSCEERE